jgi:hypothetical protein
MFVGIGVRKLPELPVLQEYFEYNPVTGVVVWNKDYGKKIRKGGVVGGLSVGLNYQLWSLSRICWLLHYGKDPYPCSVKHKNTDKLDNRIENLSLDGKGGIPKGMGKGVSFHRKSGKYRGYVMDDSNNVICLGYFPTEQEALQEVDKARKDGLGR